MRAYHCNHCVLPIRRNSRFPAEKYPQLLERVCNTPTLKIDIAIARAVSRKQLSYAHDSNFIERVFNNGLTANEQRLLGFAWSDALLKRSLHSVGGTIDAVVSALDDGVSVNLAGGTHHAKTATAAGYCLFNDVAVATRVAQLELGTERVLIVDGDVHQGDGTAEILRSNQSAYTFSIHCEENFPKFKETSDLDIAVPRGTGDADYLRHFRDGLRRCFLAARPELVIYLAGADPYVDDRLGGLSLTKKGLEDRDRLVINECRLSNVPIAIVMAGGYAPNIEDIVDIHLQTVALATALHERLRTKY